MINFNATKDEHKTIVAIARRAVKMAADYDVDYEYTCAMMDVNACHSNGNPLDLDGLLNADDFNFAHDVFGIRRHIDRETGTLGNCFVPRYSLRQSVEAK